MKLTTQQKKSYENYVINCIDAENYGLDLKTDKEKLNFLYNTFLSEYWHEYNQKRYINNKKKAFSNWIQGLPSSFNIAWTNYDILKLAKEYGSLPENANEYQENRILYHYWNFISNIVFGLFRKHKIN